MPEEDTLVRGDKIQAIRMGDGRRRAVGVKLQYLRRNETSVEAIGDQINADRHNDDPDGVDRFATPHRHFCERLGTKQCHGAPGDHLERAGQCPTRKVSRAV